MKYFTPAWHGLGGADPGLSAEAQQAVVEAYWRHVAHLLPSVPPDLHDLVEGRIDLHDGVVLGARLDEAARQLRVLLRCGDLQAGYFDLELRYGSLREPRPSAAQVEELVSLRAEALADEFDRTEEGVLVHRLLFWIPGAGPEEPYRELEIAFETLHGARTSRASREA